jgi:hypothetical protein
MEIKTVSRSVGADGRARAKSKPGKDAGSVRIE